MRWSETLYTNPGPVNFALEFARPDPQRIALIIACQNAGQIIISTNPAATVAQGIIIGPTPPYLVLELDYWGILIQQGWYEINASGFPEAFTVWEVLTTTADDAAAITPAAQPELALSAPGRIRTASRYDPVDSFDSIRQRIADKVAEKFQ